MWGLCLVRYRYRQCRKRPCWCPTLALRGFNRRRRGKPPLPVSHWRPRLQDLGLGGVVRLRGTQSEVSVGLGIRRDQQVELARLRLQFTLSPALLADLSHLKVSFNDQLIQTIVLPKERLGLMHQVELDIPRPTLPITTVCSFSSLGTTPWNVRTRSIPACGPKSVAKVGWI